MCDGSEKDPHEPGDLHVDAGLFLGFPDGALGDGLAEFLLSHGNRPLAGVPASLEKDLAAIVDGEDAGCGNQAVGGRGRRVVPVLHSAHCYFSGPEAA